MAARTGAEAKLAHHQRLLLPTHFQPLPGTHAVRSCPRNSPHPFAVRCRPRSQARRSPAASSPHPFPATPWQPRRPQPSAQFSAPICRPQPSAQPSSLITSGFFSPPISSHSRCTHAVRSRPRSSPHPFPVRSRPRMSAQPSLLISFAPHQCSSHSVAPCVRSRPSSLTSSFFSPCTHFQPLRSRPRNSPNPFPVRSRPRSQAR